MDLNWLNDFLALAEHGNFSRAADARHVTQPAFSRRIRALEEWVGVPLFDRGAQGASLTAAGTFFHPIAEEHGARSHRASAPKHGRLANVTRDSPAIAATHALSFTFFPAWVHEHVRLDRFGTVNLISDSMEACEDAMIAGEVQFLLCHHHPDVPTRLELTRHDSLVVGQDRLIPLSVPDETGAARWCITADKTRLLAYSAPSGLGRIIAALRQGELAAAKAETVFTSHLAATPHDHGQGRSRCCVASRQRSRRMIWRAGFSCAPQDEAHDIPVEIRLFRAIDGRNRAADELWQQLTMQSNSVALFGR